MFQLTAYCVAFIVCVVVCAKSHSPKLRQIILLVASYALYLTWEPWFAVVLIISTAVNFLLGGWLRRKPTVLALWTGILFNLALLSTFKYLPEAGVQSSIGPLQPFAHLIMPLGLSFWTFQAMSYLFDLYREEELDPSWVEFALYMVFFPVTISGPICRMPEMLAQFRTSQPTTRGDMERGFRRIATGIFMVQLAKLLGQGILGGDGINSGFDRITQWTGPDAWCLAFGYGLQLFLDFAGYSHIAIGAAKTLGITVPENFDRPFASTSPSVFWTRWHMSLSFWIRDYLFLPLATARREIWWRHLTLIISMVAFGLWHRASILFLLWGFYHGVLLVLHRQVQQLERKLNLQPGPLWTAIAWLLSMALINLGWIFFRANSLSQASQMLAAVVSPATYASHLVTASLFLLVAAVAGGYAVSQWIIAATESLSQETSIPEPRSDLASFLARSRWYWLPPLYALALIFLLIITLTRGATTAQFMYNKF